MSRWLVHLLFITRICQAVPAVTWPAYSSTLPRPTNEGARSENAIAKLAKDSHFQEAGFLNVCDDVVPKIPNNSSRVVFPVAVQGVEAWASHNTMGA